MLSQTEVEDDEVLVLLLRSTASRPAEGAAVSRVRAMFRASASHLECVGMSRFGSGFVESCLCRLTGVETCLLGLGVLILMKSQKGTRI